MIRRAGAVAMGWTLVAAIVVLSLAPLSDAGPDFTYSDKWGHLLAYGLLMGWFTSLYPRAGIAWRFFAGFALLGATLEVLQSALPYRDGDHLDGWADVIGLAVGMAVARAYQRFSRA